MLARLSHRTAWSRQFPYRLTIAHIRHSLLPPRIFKDARVLIVGGQDPTLLKRFDTKSDEFATPAFILAQHLTRRGHTIASPDRYVPLNLTFGKRSLAAGDLRVLERNEPILFG